MDQTNIEGQSLNTATSFQCRNDLLSKSMNFTRTRNLDTHFLIWLDTSLYAQEMYIKLRSIIDHVLLLDNIDLCIKQLTDNKEQIQGIYNDIEPLEIDLKNSVNNFIKYERMIPELFNTNNQPFTMNTLRNGLWFIKFLYVLIHQKAPSDSKDYFFNFFSFYFKGNTNSEQQLEEFIQTYESSKAVFWYTKDTFIYRILNQALRERNIQIICAYHFFIRDLYEHIAKLHQLFNERDSSLNVYRGQMMKKLEIERIKETYNLDLRISINSLISTSLDRDVALFYITGFKPKDDYHGVLFEIECKSNIKCHPFAKISSESNFVEEYEVLFMPGTAFAVNSIELDQTIELYIIKLRLCNDQEIQKGFYKMDMFNGDCETVRKLFKDMATSTLVREIPDLDQLYYHMIKLFSHECIDIDYFKALGSKHFDKKNFQTSLDYYKRSLALTQNVLSSEHRDITELYYSIAESYYQLKDYNSAIDFYLKGITFNLLSTPHSILTHLHLGYSYLSRQDWNNQNDRLSAKYHLQMALDIDSRNEMLGDSNILDICKALANIHEY
ncbi:unnamed protein product, partial [Rotaria sp. Silwood2]